jgi:hypothetical protein
MGGDSAGVAGFTLRLRSDLKVFQIGEFLIGYTSSFRMGQLLRFEFNPPEHPEGLDDFTYLVKHFIPAVRQCFKDGGYSTISSNQETGGTFIVGYRGGLYEVDDDFQVGIPFDGYAAVGCGTDIAVGALFASRHLPPRQQVMTALKASERFSAGVRAPFKILHLKTRPVKEPNGSKKNVANSRGRRGKRRRNA